MGQGAWTLLIQQAEALDAQRLQALSPLLILSPHPDDETLGCGGLIASASDLGLRPRVAFLTDGSASHPGSREWPKARLAARRRQEALAALAVLGVPETDVLFLDWLDSAPHVSGSPAYEDSLGRLAQWAAAFGPASVWAPFRGEPHCDHEAANALAYDLAGRLGSICLEYIVWGWAQPDLADRHGADRVWSLACDGQIERRGQALAQHATQLGGVVADAPDAFLISPQLAALTTRPVEIYFERNR